VLGKGYVKRESAMSVGGGFGSPARPGKKNNTPGFLGRLSARKGKKHKTELNLEATGGQRGWFNRQVSKSRKDRRTMGVWKRKESLGKAAGEGRVRTAGMI